MDAASLRRQLAEFLGDEQYRRFVAELRRGGRLRFWQEREWERFTTAHPDSIASLDDLLAALRVCELHGVELLQDEVAVVEGNIDLTERYVRARREEFPNAAAGPLYTEGAPSPGPTVDVWYCPVCRQAETQWRAAWDRQGVPSDLDLTRRTTLDEYETAWGCESFSGQRRDRWLALRAEVESSLAGGGELWEWESAGFRVFAGVCGLAVVRNGVVVRHWQLARS
jgi:hypothetical protein